MKSNILSKYLKFINKILSFFPTKVSSRQRYQRKKENRKGKQQTKEMKEEKDLYRQFNFIREKQEV